MHHNELSNTLLNLYRAARETPMSDFCDTALQTTRHLLNFETAKWGLVVTGTPDAVLFNNVHLYADEPATLEAYAQVAHEDFAALAMVASGGTTLNLNMDVLCKTHGRKGLRAYTHGVRHDNALVSCSHETRGFFRSISLYKGDDDNQFSERQRLACQLLFPHLLEAQTINMALALPAFGQEPAAQRWPRAICDGSGHLHYAEPGFVEVLRQQWSQPSAHRLPASVATELLGRNRLRYKGDQVLVARIAVCGDLHILKARPVQAVDALTPRERDVATQVTRGLSHKEIALALGLTPATARNYIQRIHAKLNVRSNAQLAGLLSAAD
jgi:DNA-binding CsgD family transcriptional regulator